MDVFKKWFGGKEQPAPEPSAVCRIIAAYLDCPCEYIPEGTSGREIERLFNAAEAEGKKQGYLPVLLATNEGNLAEMFYDNAGISDMLKDNVKYERGTVTVRDGFALDEEHLRKLREYRARLIRAWSEADAEAFLRTRVEESTEFDDEYDIEEARGGDEIFFEDIRKGITAPFDYDTKKSHELLLASIPAAEPWQVAAWLPMGNWNECPDPQDMLAMAKRWYDRYGAVICCMTSDELEFQVSNPPTDADAAYALAKEQYYFCQDRVEQYAGDYNLKTFSNGLMKSPYWYFWWD